MHAHNRVKLKICGMRDAGNISAVAALHPDYIGFIFYPGSKRFVGKDFRIPDDFPPSVKRVGVFVNEPTAHILELARQHALDFVQLHGNESVSQCETLKRKGLRLIKAFSITEEFDFSLLKSYAEFVDYFLFDNAGPGYGGTGKTFNWEILKNYDQQTPFFLSGGLSPDNISRADKLNGMNIHAVDLNSGVEIEPGMKDVTAIGELQHRRLNKYWLQS